MKVGRSGSWAVTAVLVLSAIQAGVAFAGTSPPSTLSDADGAIERLRQVSREISQSLKRLRAHLDETIAGEDRRRRAGRFLDNQPADADLTGGPADLMQLSIRKFVAFRILAARNEQYHPDAGDDLDQLQALILEARKRTSESTDVLRRLLVVSVKDLDRRSSAECKIRHDHLIKARAAAEEAAKQAYLALPVDLPAAGSAQEAAERAWDLLANRSVVRQPHIEPASARPAANSMVPALPIRIEHRKRFTLVSDTSYRMAITDAVREDARGRHLFYEEEWVQRGGAVVRLRWRVAVDPATGEHVLIKRYPPVELRGNLDDLYRSMDRDSLWYVEPPGDSPQHSLKQVESALAEVAESRALVIAAAQKFTKSVRAALLRDDQRRARTSEPLLDAGLSESLREALFTVRAHLAGVPEILTAEGEVRRAVEDAERAVAELRPLAGWANRVSGDARQTAEWDHVLLQADREIDLTRTSETEAVWWLPPDTTQAEAKFPAFQKDTIVRLRRLASRNRNDGTVRFIQEIWRPEKPMPGLREVRRTATLVVVDPKTGNQTRTAIKTKFYNTIPGDALEEVFDEYAADELLYGSGT